MTSGIIEHRGSQEWRIKRLHLGVIYLVLVGREEGDERANQKRHRGEPI